LPLEVSVNTTLRGGFPFTGVPLNAATGAGVTAATVMKLVFTSLSLPPGPVTVSRISYAPAEVNVYELSPASVNVVQVLAELSLYSQARDVILPLEVSVNTTFSGAFPFTGVPLKDRKS